ncbi:MerC domain-containing protein [Catenovulum sp. SM1970]|uniref:MerC domain-containing protein n=1 Tax=Marinifaba aquimaris TaxID=2741323 RepID=UPI0015737DEB|nr:MerC domain-containing protein [Marinifaba aquimaris]NTS78265.1 MerC domain-containing protein [Marinifaba aquimaris]
MRTEKIQVMGDKAAIGLSVFCTLHCLFLPLVLILFPTFSSIWFEGEAFHRMLLISIVPISLAAFTLGCKKHKNISVAVYGLTGLLILVIAGFFMHDLLGELGEKVFTVIGAAVVAFGHYKNHQLCKQKHCSSC